MFLDDLVVEKRVQVENVDGHGDQWGMDGLNWVDEIELDDIDVDGRVNYWNTDYWVRQLVPLAGQHRP